jgi:hypothetical protein
MIILLFLFIILNKKCLGGWVPEFFSCLGYIVGWKPEYFGCLGFIVSCGYPTRTHTHTRGNSVAHVWFDEISIDFNIIGVFWGFFLYLFGYMTIQFWYAFEYHHIQFFG